MVQLTVQGDDVVIRALRLTGDQSKRKELMEDIGSYGESSTMQRFIEERGPGGISWEKSLRAKEENGQTLRDFGHLYNSLTYDFNETSVSWGTNKQYAGIHQFGGTIRPKSAKKLAFRLADGRFVLTDKVDIPARPFLGIDDADRQEIQDITKDWIKGSLYAR